MDMDGFTVYLKRRGKQPHVIQGLVLQVEAFEHFLSAERGKTLEETEGGDILGFTEELEKTKPGTARKGIRGLALYFHFIGNEDMTRIARGLREESIAKNRTSFRLRDFMGISTEFTNRLESVGISHADTMLEKGATSVARNLLAEQTGIPKAVILELVKLSDLSRIEGVKSIRARLYHDAGVDTVEKLAAQDPVELLRLTAEFVERTGFKGIPPLPMEAHHTIQAARELAKIVDYDQ